VNSSAGCSEHDKEENIWRAREEVKHKGELWEGIILKGKSRVYRKKCPPKLLIVGWRGEREKKEKRKAPMESFFNALT